MDSFIRREHSSFPPKITRILLKLFCQHPDQAGFIFNDILMLLLHSYKDCFDTSRIFDSPVKIKYWKRNKKPPSNPEITYHYHKHVPRDAIWPDFPISYDPRVFSWNQRAPEVGLLINCSGFLRFLSAPKLLFPRRDSAHG